MNKTKNFRIKVVKVKYKVVKNKIYLYKYILVIKFLFIKL